MNDSTKVRHAVERELEEMRNCISRFDLVVAEAQALARDCRESAERAETAIRELEVDRAIERADRLLKRGPYLALREEECFGREDSDAELAALELVRGDGDNAGANITMHADRLRVPPPSKV